MEPLARIAILELRCRACADAGALVTADAERLGAVTRRAVLAALRIDHVQREVVTGMKIRRLDDTLVALDTLGLVVTSVARIAGLPRLLRVVVREARSMLIAESVACRHEATVLELGHHQAAELREMAVGAVALLGTVLVTAE